MADNLIGPTIWAGSRNLTLPPFAHNFTLPELSLKALRENCYLVEREHYDALLRDAERYRWLRAQHWWESQMCVVTKPKDTVMLGTLCPFEKELDQLIDDSRGGSP